MKKNLLVKEISRRIVDDFGIGNELPGERQLASRYICARGTIRSALSRLDEQGMLETVSGVGHRLVVGAEDSAENDGSRSVKWPIVALISFGTSQEDPHHMDVVAGATSYSSANGINLINCELRDIRQIDNLNSLQSLHAGLDVDGYIVAGKPPHRLRKMLEASVRPCVVLGDFLDEHSFQRGRFTQVLLPVETVYRQVAQNLFNMGHQKVLLVFRGSEDVFSDQVGSAFEREIAARKSSDFCVDSYYANLDFEHFQTKKDVYQAAEKIIGKLDESYSALVVMSGDYFGFSVWKHLLESGRSIPEELSLVVASGRHDLFVELFEITTVFTDAWQEGFACAKEIARQIGSNVIEGGVKYSEYRYIQRKTVAPVGMTEILL